MFGLIMSRGAPGGVGTEDGGAIIGGLTRDMDRCGIRGGLTARVVVDDGGDGCGAVCGVDTAVVVGVVLVVESKNGRNSSVL